MGEWEALGRVYCNSKKELRKMELRKINEIDAKAQWEYTTALPEDENGLTNPYNGVSYDDYIEKVLPTLISYEHPVNMPDWFVPETYYYLWDDGRLVGEFRIRHHLTEALKSGAGHIGYSIRRDEWGKGYATAGLKLTLQEARKIGELTDYSVSVGKSGKYMKKWLSEEEWQKYLDTYCGTDVNDLCSAVESMCRLFYDVSKWVAEHGNFVFDRQEADNSFKYFSTVKEMDENAVSIF